MRCDCGWQPKPGDAVELREGERTEYYCPRCSTWSEMNDDRGKGGDDPVNHPPHYKFGKYEVHPICMAWLKANDVSGEEAANWYSMMQYAFRYKKKGGKTDLEKMKWYVNKLIEGKDE